MDASQATIIPIISRWVESLRTGNDPERSNSDQSEQTLPAPEKVAIRGAGMLGIELDDDAAKAWGTRVHWMHGIQFGVLYQALYSRPSARSGLAYGALLWLLSDELLLWAIGVAKAPTNYPASTHVSALVAHSVYGAVVGIAAKGLSRT